MTAETPQQVLRDYQDSKRKHQGIGLLILIIDYNLINEDVLARNKQTNRGVIGDEADGCRVRGAVGV